jgi:hypothetical protein
MCEVLKNISDVLKLCEDLIMCEVLEMKIKKKPL